VVATLICASARALVLTPLAHTFIAMELAMAIFEIPLGTLSNAIYELLRWRWGCAKQVSIFIFLYVSIYLRFTGGIAKNKTYAKENQYTPILH
jgi:hypothetical protein